MNTQTLATPEANLQQAERRYLILEILHQTNDRSMNEIILNMILMDTFDTINPDELRADLFWLQDQGLTLIQVHQGLHIAELTSFGVQFVNRQKPAAPNLQTVQRVTEKDGSMQENVHNRISEVEA